MNRVFDLLLRCVAIMFGYAVAALCASAFLHLVTLPMLGFTAEEAPAIAMGSIVFSIPFIALFVAYFAFIPSVLVIIAGELLGLRDWLYHALGGGVTGMVVTGYFRTAAETGNPVAEPGFMLALIGAGMAGGLGYWLIAGRRAGGWRQRRIISPEPK